MNNENQNFIRITEKDYKSQFKILSIMKIGKDYSDQQLQAVTELGIWAVKNNINFLRKCINFIYKDEVHHIALNQMTKKTFSYILRRGLHTPESDYFLPKKKQK